MAVVLQVAIHVEEALTGEEGHFEFLANILNPLVWEVRVERSRIAPASFQSRLALWRQLTGLWDRHNDEVGASFFANLLS